MNQTWCETTSLRLSCSEGGDLEIEGRSRLVLAALVVAAATALFGVVLFQILQDSGGQSSKVTSLEPSNQVHVSQSTDSRDYIVNATSHTGLDERPASEAALLNIACPDEHAELTSDCIDALDEFFMDSVLPHWESRIDRLLLLGTPPTFNKVFEDPSTNRSLTLEALSREECRLEEGSIHPELHVNCNAKAIASHALFIKYCMPSTSNYRDDWFGPMPGGFEGLTDDRMSYYEYELAGIERFRGLDPDTYKQRRQRLKNKVLRSAWIEAQCSKFDSSLYQPLNGWPSVQQSAMAEHVEQFGDDLLQWEPSARIQFQREILDDEYSRLLSISARLGDEWAVTEYYRRGKKDEEFLTSIEETHPWLPYLRRATLTSVPKTELLTDAIRAVVLAGQEGLKIDRKLLVQVACRNIPIFADCATAFRQIEYLNLSPQEFQIATELRKIAYEQELIQ